MPITTSDIDQYRTAADTAASSAASFSAKAPTVETELLDALNSKLATNKPLIEGKNEAMAQYLKSGTEAKAQYSDPTSAHYVFNPYQRESLISGAQSMAYQPYANLSDYLGLAMGKVENLAKQGFGQYQSEAQNRLSQAQLAQNQYSQALDEYMKMQQLALEKQKAAGSGGSGVGQMLAQLLMGGGQEEVEVPPKLGYDPETNQVREYADGKVSPKGQWIVQNGQWVKNPSYTGTTGGGETDQRQLVGAMMMSMADSPTEIAAAYNMMYPTEKSAQVKVRQEQAAKGQAYSKAERLINEALQVIGQKGSAAGWDPLYGVKKSGALGMKADPTRLKLDAILSELAGPLAFGEAGKALTATELGLIGGKVPTVGLSENTLTNMLNQVMSNIQAQREEYLFSQVGL